MTFREALERHGLNVEELLNTEVGSYKSGQTFWVEGNIVSENPGDPGRIELMVTALKWDAPGEPPKAKRRARKK